MIEKAIELIGSRAEFCRAVDMSPQFLSQILNGRRPLPARYALRIENYLGGRITRHDLRPDIYPRDAA